MKEKLSKVLKSFKTKKNREAEHISMVRASEYFNGSWYLQKYEDVRSAGMDAATHYVKYGWREGRNPGPCFDTMVFLSNHKDLLERGICPLVYLAENSETNDAGAPHSVTRMDSATRRGMSTLRKEGASVIEGSYYFDEEWYRERYHVSGNVITHYGEHAECCNPSLMFNSSAYLEAYPDVKKAKVNPLLHYEKYGKHEGRYPFPVSLEETTSRLRQKLKDGEISGLKILYVSTTQRVEQPILDASTRYRCFHPAEVLLEAGALVHVISTNKLLTRPIPFDYDIYIFHRPSTNLLGRVIPLLKSQNKVLIAEYDDLIFGSEEDALGSSIFKNKVAPRQQCINIFEGNAKALRAFDYVSVSTTDLVSRVMRAHPSAKVHVIHNFIPQSILILTRDYHKYKKDPNQIIYCCGTLSHNADFKVVNQVLVDCLKKDEKLRLVLMGPLTVDGELCTLPNVYFHPHVGYWDLFRLMCNSAFTIAPLEMSVFNDCKSNVKFLESCVAGTHLLASPIPDMTRVSDANLELCVSAEDFRRSIENRHNLNLEEMAQQNYDYLVKNCSANTFMKEFTQMIKSIEI